MNSKSKAKKNQALWNDAMTKYKLNERHVAMAKRLNMNPKNFSRYATPKGKRKQQGWKLPLPQFIEKTFAKKYPHSPEGQRAIAQRRARKAARREKKRAQVS
ncbi:conserved hypothetical protein [Hyella patelloides LEGE 07179]|uniref:Uncharacterized protein n=2 Tax=Hyella TaxID=945733 RepID=A0A563VYA8_9CYAN|nr:conserved hypothetical protein [Hyella patelloides LEGE 07179]